MTKLLALALLIASACAPGTASGAPTPTANSPTPSVTPTLAATPSLSPIVLPSYAQLSAPSSNVVWALVGGRRLFVSTNQGNKWDERTLPPRAANPVLSSTSDRQGWLASSDPASPCASDRRSLWRTNDGAVTWQEVNVSGISAALCPASLSFVEAQRGYLGALDSRVGPVVYRTSDGAASWLGSSALSDPPDLPMQGGRADMELGPVRAFGTSLLLASRVRSAAIVPTQYVYSSTDGGASWSYAAAVPVTGALAFVTASRWLRIGPAHTAVESTDTGKTWRAFTTDYAQAAPIPPELVFADGSVGYATVRGAIQRTTDGGAHWVSLPTPGTQ